MRVKCPAGVGLLAEEVCLPERNELGHVLLEIEFCDIREDVADELVVHRLRVERAHKTLDVVTILDVWEITHQAQGRSWLDICTAVDIIANADVRTWSRTSHRKDNMVIGVRDLAKNASAIVNGVSSGNERAVITKRGLPVAVIVPVDATELEDYVLANAPESVSAMSEANAELADGRTISLEDVLAELS